MSASPTFDDVLAAARRLEGVAIRTPLLENTRVNARLGGRLFIKAECLQRTGSFKLRGAYNFLASMSEADRKKGVVGWSSGNHAQGLAEAARLMGMKATIVMPADAPALKIANTKASGAEVVLHDRVKDSREEIGMGIAKKTGATVVPPYDHPWILTGQGTAGLEIVEQAKALGVTLDAVAAPCSGGGLSTGIALAVKGLSPNTSVHAGEPAGFDDLARSLASRHQAEERQALGLDLRRPAGADAGRRHLSASPRSCSARDWSSPMTRCSTPWRLAFREFKLVVEPGGAVALAAALTGKLPVKGRAVAVVCSGGNVDHATFARALASPRRMRMSNRVAESLEDLLLAQHGSSWSARSSARAGGEEPLRGMATGIASSLFIATPILLLEVKGRRLPLVRRLQRLPLVLYFAIRVVFYTIVIVVGLVAARLVVDRARQVRARSSRRRLRPSRWPCRCWPTSSSR